MEAELSKLAGEAEPYPSVFEVPVSLDRRFVEEEEGIDVEERAGGEVVKFVVLRWNRGWKEGVESPRAPSKGVQSSFFLWS